MKLKAQVGECGRGPHCCLGRVRRGPREQCSSLQAKLLSLPCFILSLASILISWKKGKIKGCMSLGPFEKHCTIFISIMDLGCSFLNLWFEWLLPLLHVFNIPEPLLYPCCAFIPLSPYSELIISALMPSLSTLRDVKWLVQSHRKGTVSAMTYTHDCMIQKFIFFTIVKASAEAG